VCVCVVQVYPMLWGQNIPTKTAISKIFDLEGTFFGPREKNIMLSEFFFFKSKNAESFLLMCRVMG